MNIEESQKAFMESCCSHSCDEGRTCPRRIEYAGDEPRDYFSIAIVVVLLTLIASIVFSPEIAEMLYRGAK